MTGTVLALSAAALAGMLAMLWAQRLTPVLPYRLLLQLALYVPSMWALDRLAVHLSRWFTRPSVRPLAALALCAALVALYGASAQILLAAQLTAILVFLTEVASAGLAKRDSAAFKTIAVIVVGNVAVWSSNYVALATTSGRMADAMFRDVDLTFYRSAMGPWVNYEGLFPLLDSPGAFWLLQTCYVFFFPQVALAAFALSDDSEQLQAYVRRMFFCYAVTLLIFIALPVAGPALAYPASLRPAYMGTETELLMRSVRLEYERVLAGLQPYTGFGSFAAFPSLHAALAVVFQSSYSGKPFLYWTLLPINVLLCVATVALGWHYAIDSVAGLAMGWVALILIQSGSPKTGLQDSIGPDGHVGVGSTRQTLPSGPSEYLK